MSPGFTGLRTEFVTQAGPVEMLREPDVQGPWRAFWLCASGLGAHFLSSFGDAVLPRAFRPSDGS
jgi:hypothetical protein